MNKLKIKLIVTLFLLLFIVCKIVHLHTAKSIVSKILKTEKIFWLDSRVKHCIGDLHKELNAETNGFEIDMNVFTLVHIEEIWSYSPPQKDYFKSYKMLSDSPNIMRRVLGNIALLKLSVNEVEREAILKKLLTLKDLISKNTNKIKPKMSGYQKWHVALHLINTFLKRERKAKGGSVP